MNKAKNADTAWDCVKNCNAAIKKFKAAKAINTDLAALCNKQIGIANSLLAHPVHQQTPEVLRKKMDSLVVKQRNVCFEYDGDLRKEVEVASTSKWTAIVPAEHTGWCSVSASDDNKRMVITCQSNVDTTVPRSTMVIVSSQSESVGNDTVWISQKGLPVELDVQVPKGSKLGQTFMNILLFKKNSTNGTALKLEMKKKGDTKTVVVQTNSDVIHSDKLHDEWKEFFVVVEKPEWCEVMLDYVANQKLKETEYKESLKKKTRVLKVLVRAIPKDDMKAQNMGRDGMLVIQSQDQIVHLPIYQIK